MANEMASAASGEAVKLVFNLKSAVEDVVAGKVSWQASHRAERTLLDYIARLEIANGKEAP